MATSGDAEAAGLVTSLWPGGNVTGLTFFNPELAAKRFELLKEILPGLTEVGLLLNPENPINEPIVPLVKLTAQRSGWKFIHSASAAPPSLKAPSRQWQPNMSAQS